MPCKGTSTSPPGVPSALSQLAAQVNGTQVNARSVDVELGVPTEARDQRHLGRTRTVSVRRAFKSAREVKEKRHSQAIVETGF